MRPGSTARPPECTTIRRLSKLFSELAQWEKRHVEVFAEMKNQLPGTSWEQGGLNPDRVDVSRLDAPPAVFDEHSDPARRADRP